MRYFSTWMLLREGQCEATVTPRSIAAKAGSHRHGNVRGVLHALKALRRVSAGVAQDGIPTGVQVDVARDVVHATPDDNPRVAPRAMRGDVGGGVGRQARRIVEGVVRTHGCATRALPVQREWCVWYGCACRY